MNKQQKIIVSIVGITIVLLALLGITYAYYLTRIQGNTNTNSISITTADLKLVYADGNGLIEKANFMPGDEIEKTFTVENTGKNKVNGYVIVLEDVVNELIRREDLTYTLECRLENDYSCGSVTSTLYPKSSSLYIVYTNDIEVDIIHYYTLKIKYEYLSDIDQSDDMGSSISGKINIKDAKEINLFSTGVSSVDTTNLAYNIIENARTEKNGTKLMGTALSGVGTSISGQNYGSNLITKPEENLTVNTQWFDYYWTYAEDYTFDEKNGVTLINPITCKYRDCYKEFEGNYIYTTVTSAPVVSNVTGTNFIINVISTGELEDALVGQKIGSDVVSIDESILAMTQDENGTSYYYRGSVVDNYINFAEMCWRIVRINGDNSIKLVLEDQDNTCETSDGNFNALGVDNYIYGYDEDSNSNKIINYLKGAAITFKTFQNQKLSSYLNKLKYGDWCYDDRAYIDDLTEVLSKEEYHLNNVGYQYGTFFRLERLKQPSLICEGTLLNDYTLGYSESVTSPMYVGTLTADEVTYAGAYTTNPNTNYYLVNGTDIAWWTMSPYSFYDTNSFAYLVTSEGYMGGGNVSYGASYRPSVNLKAGTSINVGDGTKTNPYVIAS